MENYGRRVGARIRALREARGWSQNRLAHEMNTPTASASQISRWERGVFVPSRPNLEALGRALGVPAERFLYDPDED